MLFGSLSWLLTLFTASAVVLGSATAATANWISIKNDTGKTITIQETVVVNGQVKRGKATNLLAGETLREFVAGPTVKRVEIFDAQSPDQAAWCGKLDCKDEQQTFSVSVAGGKFTVGQVVVPPKK